MLVMLCASSVWLASAQKPEEGGDVPSVPPVGPALRPKIDPALLKQLTGGDGRYAPVIVEVTGAADLTTAMAVIDPRQRRQAVISSLQATATETQASVRALLTSREATGDAANVRSFWIFNGLAADANLDTVLALASQPDVKIVRLDRQYHIINHPQRLLQTIPHSLEIGSNIAQIRADLVWSALGMDGSGTVVANVDTGVDWLHPALLSRYRGYDPHGLHQHACNWFDATGDGALYPVDGAGHGTHTMGTIVGGEGMGVAPGAEWMAVRAFNSQGNALESWLHAALQWVVYPGPGCVPPDVVNNSWGRYVGSAPNFRADVQAIRAAGIFAAFAAGNEGSDSATINAPASYPESFSVGAVTADDIIANFSSRGPSTWFGSNLVKPEVSAPGVNVRSSMPGGAYGETDGTSMAAPHVAGVSALMLQANPGLTVVQLESVIKQTAKPLGSTTPNNDYGWGRIDAYAAVASVANVGTISGAVTDATNGSPLADALLVATSIATDSSSSVAASADGTYTLALAPGEYALTASAFGFVSQPRQIEVQVDTTLTRNFALSKLPTGTLTGRVTGNGQPIQPPRHTIYLPFVARDAHINTDAASHSTGTTFSNQSASGYPIVVVEGTPITVTPDADGYYTAYLPAGSYTLTVSSLGYWIATASEVPIVVQGTTVRNFDLAPAPTVLLVDSGAWYYDSQIHYYRQALDQLSYTYDVWTIREPVNGAPRASDLHPYDVVFWSSPEDSPGYVNASHALASYMEDGGSLFLSGQDVAYYDDYFPHIYASYFRDYLKARYVRDNTGISDLAGQTGSLFEGLAFSISGSGGADNQTSPDEISVLDHNFASSVVSYINDGSAGQEVNLGLPYRTIYLSYGLEAITSTVVRTEIISRSIAWLTAPPASTGLEMTPDKQSLIGSFGGIVTHTVRVRNTAETDSPDTFDLPLADSPWPIAIITPSITLAPCASAPATLSVEVQTAATPWLRAAAIRPTRAPAPVLLVGAEP